MAGLLRARHLILDRMSDQSVRRVPVAAIAPLYFNRNARFVPSADSSEQPSPSPTDSETPVTVGTSEP